MEKLVMNEYFSYMKNKAIELSAKSKFVRDQIRKIIAEYGFDSEEYKLVSQMEKDIVDPFSNGEWKAYHAWGSTVYKDHDAEVLVETDFLWENEVAGFVHALRTAGLSHFYYANSSTACMENIHGFIAAGCKMIGTVTVTEDRGMFERTYLGIEFEL